MEFVSALATARDIDAVLAVHTEYLLGVHKRCLLHHDVEMIKSVASRLLNQALLLSQRWEMGLIGMR